MRLLTLLSGLLLAANSWGQTPLRWNRMVTEPKALGRVEASVLFDDGQGEKLYVAGRFRGMGGSAATNLARFDGAVWEGIQAPIEGTIKTLGVFDEGNGPRLFLGGDFVGRGILLGSDFIARFDGSVFSSVGGGMDGHVRCLHVFDDGLGPGLYVGGRFFTAGAIIAPMIAQWDGSQWSSLDGGAVFPGSFVYGVFALSTFDPGGSPVLVAGGSFNGVGTPVLPVNNLATWNGVNWSSLGLPVTSGLETVDAIAEFDAGAGPELYVGGSRAPYSQLTGNDRVLRFNGFVWSQLGAGIDPYLPSSAVTVASKVEELRVFDDGNGMALHVGGVIGRAGGVDVNHWARWDGQNWNAPPGRVYSRTGLETAIRSLLPLPSSLGGGVLVAGAFESGGNGPRNSIVRWTPGGMMDLGSASGALLYLGEESGVLDQVASISDANGDGLVITGSFKEIGGIPADGIARWDGTSFQDMAGVGLEFSVISVVSNGVSDELFALSEAGVLMRVGSNWVAQGPYDALGSLRTRDRAITYADHGAGPVLYAAGQLATGPSANSQEGIYQLSGNAWTRLPAMPTIPQLGDDSTPQEFFVGGLISWDDGNGEALYAYGIAVPAGAVALGFGVVSRWDGQAWQLLPTLQFANAQARGVSPQVACVYESEGDSALYFGASFFGPAGSSIFPTHRLTRWTGSAWEDVGPPIPANSVRGLFSHDAGNGPELYLYGEANTGSTLWAVSGTSWRTVTTTSGSRIAGMASFDDGGGADLYASAELFARPNGRRTDILNTFSPMDSRVGSGVSIPQPVLGVSVAGGTVTSPRSIEIPLGQSFSVHIAQPLTTAAPAAYALALFAGPPPPSAFTAPGFGDLSIPLPPTPGSIWFASAATGIPALATGTTAPWSIPVIGGIPFATTVTLQGAIADDSSTLGFSLTNALSLRIR